MVETLVRHFVYHNVDLCSNETIQLDGGREGGPRRSSSSSPNSRQNFLISFIKY